MGDIESQPFLEAARQVRADLGRENVAFVHVSLIPFLSAAGELKTKPTQHLVAALRSIGIQFDALVLRTDRPLPEGVKSKVALMCDVDASAVIEYKNAASIASEIRHMIGVLNDELAFQEREALRKAEEAERNCQ